MNLLRSLANLLPQARFFAGAVKSGTIVQPPKFKMQHQFLTHKLTKMAHAIFSMSVDATSLDMKDSEDPSFLSLQAVSTLKDARNEERSKTR